MLTVAVSQIPFVFVMRRRYEFVYLKHMVKCGAEKDSKKKKKKKYEENV